MNFKFTIAERPEYPEGQYVYAEGEVIKLLREHLTALARRRLMHVYKTPFGGENYANAWKRDVKQVAENLVWPKLDDISKAAIERSGDVSGVLTRLIDGAAREQSLLLAESMHDMPSIEDLDGIEYEHYCATLLRKAGWECEVTKAGGDQGVDIIARKSSLTVVFQCKKYSSPVGNAAVQEILAAKAYLRANLAAVVSNNSYTNAAILLAESTGVRLLNHTELPSFCA